MHAAEFRRCLVELDVAAIRRLHAHVAPHLPAPASDREALISLHHARTQAAVVPDRLRFYSHRWLLDNGYPSGLPDMLKPRAEREYPAVAAAVGVSYNARSSILAPIVPLVRRSMEAAVLEADADGKLLDTPHVRQRMKEARSTTIEKLVGLKIE